jgi:hypothetical protein
MNLVSAQVFLPIILLNCAALLSACAPPEGISCSNGEQASIEDTLYFGANKPGGAVTAEEWSGFLNGFVTPRFPNGLTVSQAAGQWRGASGELVRENSYVLKLVHANDPGSETAIQEITEEYKVKFRQQVVLRVKSQACVSF